MFEKLEKKLDQVIDDKGLKTYMDINLAPSTYFSLAATLIGAGAVIILLHRAFGK